MKNYGETLTLKEESEKLTFCQECLDIEANLNFNFGKI